MTVMVRSHPSFHAKPEFNEAFNVAEEETVAWLKDKEALKTCPDNAPIILDTGLAYYEVCEFSIPCLEGLSICFRACKDPYGWHSVMVNTETGERKVI